MYLITLLFYIPSCYLNCRRFMSEQPRKFRESGCDRDRIEVDILLPYGVLIPLQCKRTQKLVDIKTMVWREAQKYPLAKLLWNDPSRYQFMCVNQRAEKIELYDETKSLADIKPYKPILQLFERVGDREEKEFNAKMSVLIGKGVYEMEQSNEEEVVHFRAKMLDKCKQAVVKRANASWEERAMYKFAPSVYQFERLLPESMEQQVGKEMSYRIQVFVKGEYLRQMNDDVMLSIRNKPNLLAAKVLQSCHMHGLYRDKSPPDFVFKIFGREECLLGDEPMINYEYVKSCVMSHKIPELIFLLKEDLELNIKEEFPRLPPAAIPSPPKEAKYLWDLYGVFYVKALEAKGINVNNTTPIQLYLGLYHGSSPITDIKFTKAGHGSNPVWNETVLFEDLEASNIPRGARLCCVLYHTVDSKNAKKKQKVPLAWVNLAMFDYRYLLRTSTIELAMWSMEDNEATLEEDLHPLGVAGPNPTGQMKLILEFIQTEKPVKGPSQTQMIDYASTIPMSNYTGASKLLINDLDFIVSKDPLAELTDQDIELIWKLRGYLMAYMPIGLPKLVSSVKWNSREQVSQMLLLLQSWPLMSPSQALELLDYNYQEPAVRSFAIRCLENASDAEISRYLLQLVQALKYEAYLDCDLATFLLDRAWNNQRIGHYLFWYLRAEMKSPIARTRFGLMLEAYCRGSISHLPILLRQIEAVRVMKRISKEVQNLKTRDKDKIKTTLMNQLQSEANIACLTGITSILNPAYKLTSFIAKSCRAFDSKMKPLLLTYDNTDSKTVTTSLSPTISIIFKRGDDLRQDMLTLQIFETMDKIWQEADLYLKILPYGCIATSHRGGLIEAVMNAETIANIQKNAGTIAFLPKKSVYQSLYDWLTKNNPTEASLEKAIDTFTRSCAAYCVATYVLGIGDRHSDNIMLRNDGHLFHIDFGHFLGNFKTKFGFRRERVPFILTYDFVYIICNGNENFAKTDEFKRFAAMCGKAYLALRQKAGILLNLLAMMLSTGIPQLRTISDLNYVRDALALNSTEEEARLHFDKQMYEALEKTWSTSMNWFFHSLAKDNRNK